MDNSKKEKEASNTGVDPTQEDEDWELVEPAAKTKAEPVPDVGEEDWQIVEEKTPSAASSANQATVKVEVDEEHVIAPGGPGYEAPEQTTTSTAEAPAEADNEDKFSALEREQEKSDLKEALASNLQTVSSQSVMPRFFQEVPSLMRTLEISKRILEIDPTDQEALEAKEKCKKLIEAKDFLGDSPEFKGIKDALSAYCNNSGAKERFAAWRACGQFYLEKDLPFLDENESAVGAFKRALQVGRENPTEVSKPEMNAAWKQLGDAMECMMRGAHRGVKFAKPASEQEVKKFAKPARDQDVRLLGVMKPKSQLESQPPVKSQSWFGSAKVVKEKVAGGPAPPTPTSKSGR